MIAGVMSMDFDPIREQNAVGSSLVAAQAALEKAENAQREAKSDWAYWGYEGDRAYWHAVVDILTAANLVGADSLPDVAPPSLANCVVMDACAKVERFGREIREQAEEIAALRKAEVRDG